MQVTEIRAEFRKTLSDGNYGNETHSISLLATLSEGEHESDAAQALMDRASSHVLGALRASRDRHIRRALMTPDELDADYEAERRENDERYARREEERLAQTGRQSPRQRMRAALEQIAEMGDSESDEAPQVARDVLDKLDEDTPF